MARPPASPEQREKQRQRIRRAAAEVYNDDGPMGVTVRAVSKRAGVSTGTLYSYFANLEELMQSLWVEPVAAVGRELEAAVVDIDEPVERIRFLLSSYVRFCIEQPDVFRGAVLFVRPSGAPTPDAEPPEALPFFRLLRDSLIDGQAAGEVRSGDPDMLAQLLWAAVHGSLALPVNLDRFAVKAQAELGPAMVDNLMDGLVGIAPSPAA